MYVTVCLAQRYIHVEKYNMKHYSSLYLILFAVKMYNIYAEILFCYMLTCGIRLLVPKIQIFTHMYISMSTCM